MRASTRSRRFALVLATSVGLASSGQGIKRVPAWLYGHVSLPSRRHMGLRGRRLLDGVKRCSESMCMTINEIEVPIVITQKDLRRFFWDRIVRAKKFRVYIFLTTLACVIPLFAPYGPLIAPAIWLVLLATPFAVAVLAARRACRAVSMSDPHGKAKIRLTEDQIEMRYPDRVEMLPWTSLSGIIVTQNYVYGRQDGSLGSLPALLIFRHCIPPGTLAQMDHLLRRVSKGHKRGDGSH